MTDVDLPTGEPMPPADATRIMCASLSRVVVLGGAQGSGKTTLISSIYERFRRGPFAGLSFAGSETLLGFERISHPGRQVSELVVPDTDHTSRQLGRQMLHLRLYENATQRHQDILLTDMSGEEYEGIRNFGDSAQHLGIVSRADHFVFLVDGEKLLELGLRHQVFDEAQTILQALLEVRLLTCCSRVDVLFSKWDAVAMSAAKDEAEAFTDTITSRLEMAFDAKFGLLRFDRISARAPNGRTLPAEGLERLLPSWCNEGQLPLHPSGSDSLAGAKRRQIDWLDA